MSAPTNPHAHRTQPQINGDDDDDGADPVLRWNSDGSGFVNSSAQAANSFGLLPAQPQPDQVARPSNSLTRRDTNQALVATHHRNFDSSMEPWTGFGADNSPLHQTEEGSIIERDDVEALEEMAQKMKKELQASRKQIPPFVQKLSSFLEDKKNEHFIRWSEKGDSFIVVDEEEFAKRLIPELFKHNNYASFVRQLNMYGFHKRVGLSDNSMRASERKNKSPSEYYNIYFRRGHPNLLWLITKPRSRKAKTTSKHKSDDGDGDTDDDQLNEDANAESNTNSNLAATSRSLPAPPSESQSIPKKEMSLIRDELSKVREQQKRILGAINQLQHNNNDLYNQALLFQNQHDRHQNSINAILKFLANVFRKTLEDQGNMQSVSDIISSMITNQGQQQPQQGSVVDLGDFFQTQLDPTSTPGGGHKRARGLLPPIPHQPEATPSAGSTPSYHPLGNQNPEMGHVTELVDGIDTPPNLRHELENNPHERMMKIINDHNATSRSSIDLPQAAELVANAPNALSQDQRSKLADFMAGQSPPAPSTVHTPPPAPAPTKAAPTRAASASLSPAPDALEMPSMSPIMKSPQMAPPSLNQINLNQIDLDVLQRLQSDQDAKIHELSEMLGPFSPSGQIPGLAEGHEVPFDPSVDLEQYFDSNAFLNDATFGADGNDFNFSLDGDGLGGGDSVLGKKTTADEVTNPTISEEVLRDRGSEDGLPTQSGKRRKIG
ncbi:Heat shock factor (HSF)-type, DNA-binding protein [Moelleriella libera RCEF 2490]|uniref:Heat shock factor (HSF)-type, DNA-binding protein n=1 Tax=Moelleriella libera RCEF 2490 TaxID=1081109 RepID=A0A167YLR9_9HYPO|nr:Heat shock factor (HSF)-type, DNA-binding protein [Moelleriella libera RCEF 2490]